MFLFDKYKIKPITNKIYYNPKLFFNEDIAKDLYIKGHDNEIQNFLFYGNNGCGRHSLVNLLLYYIYGEEIYNIKSQQYTIKTNNNTIEYKTIKQSQHHIIYYPQKNNFDKNILQSIIQSFITIQNPNNYLITNDKLFKIIVIDNIENLSISAQESLKATIEKYSKICRFIFISKSIDCIIDALKSRIVPIKIDNPNNNQLLTCAINICHNEKQNYNINDLMELVNKSNQNIKKLMFLLQLYFLKVPIIDSIDKAYNDIINLIYKKSFKYTKTIINKIYDILITNIESKQIIKELLDRLIKKENNMKLINKFIKISIKHSKLLSNSRRDIMMLKDYINCLIVLLKKYDNN